MYGIELQDLQLESVNLNFDFYESARSDDNDVNYCDITFHLTMYMYY